VIVLGFDTSTHATAVGLRLADGSTLHARDDPASGEHPGHATRLLTMADELIARAGISWAALERIAVGLGPGRFTGLRVGVATARGLAQSLSVDVAGVSTLRALAEAALAAGEGSGRVLAVIDALRGEVFAEGFAAAGGGAVCELEIPQALGPGALAEAVQKAAGREHGDWWAVGDGALRYRVELASVGVSLPDDSSPLHGVDGRAICEIAARTPAAQHYGQLRPDYRRRPDAETRRPGAERDRGARAAGGLPSELQAASR
jgi:tRNA threonylcarbamoyladenosine biosynthesis protein TsaB